MKFQSKLIGRSVVISLPQDDPRDPPAELLLLKVEIDCPQCGPQQIQVAGHHLRALRNLLVEIIDRHPDLCGEESGIEVVNRLQFNGRPPSDPSVN